MGWVRKIPPPTPHECPIPTERRTRTNHNDYQVEYDAPPSSADKGSVWRCDDCGKLWEVIKWLVNDGDDFLAWVHAGWWTRRKYKVREVTWQ